MSRHAHSAVVTLAAGILVASAGLRHPRLAFLFDGAWFSATLISFVRYALFMRRRTPAAASAAEPATLSAP